MVLWAALLFPLAGAAVVLAFRSARSAAVVAGVVGAAEIGILTIVIRECRRQGVVEAGSFLRADGLTALFLLNLSLVFALVLVYSMGYLRHIPAGRFSSPRWFYALFFLFVSTMVGVLLSANLGLLWIMMEATTLASALLVGFYNTEGAVEAGWKYLIVCTVGMAFALFGTIVFYLAAVKSGIDPQAALDWVVLMDRKHAWAPASHLLKLGFVFVVVGYGTKIGLVPMHSWLPDAHAEAPSPISAMLSAVLLNCALYGLLRFDAIMTRAMDAGFSHFLLLVFGVASFLVAALLMLVQRDLKRLFAYSSIEHMGIVATGVGLGGALGLYGALLHTFNHSVAKSLLFFVAGNVRENFGSLSLRRIRGMAHSLPWTSAALVLGSVAIVGMPPFGLFVSELTILSEAFGQSRYGIAALMLAAISLVFGALTYHFLRMLGGTPTPKPAVPLPIPTEVLVISVAAATLLWFGISIPSSFKQMLEAAVAVTR